MDNKTIGIIDGNEAAAYVAHKTNEICAIYPITPSSNMGEWADQWSAEGRKNIWGTIPLVAELQSEGGASGAVHGALQTGALTTTFTASQGLLLMIPNMYKIAGELTSTVFHVSARSLACQALSIFGDHSDVMATRQTGFAMLASNSVQEVMDTALIAQKATLASRIPFLHFFDGFRTSHEVQKMEVISDDAIRAMMPDDLIAAHRARALSPDRPVLRGTAQNPDVYFQGRETVNPFYDRTPAIVQQCMDDFAKLTGRAYRIMEYHGAPDADRVIVQMGSACETTGETVKYLNAQGAKIGLLIVRLYRPFSVSSFLAALPKTVRSIAVLDRTKEPGAAGEPLYQDVITALGESLSSGARASMPRVIGGRYGLSSKEFTPAMVKAVFDELAKTSPKNHFTVGIRDDVSNTSLEVDDTFMIEPDSVVRAMFFGLGADGTVGANKNSIKIIGEETDMYAQGYFVYDSKKAGSRTVSHLRFGPEPIRSPYLIQSANFIGCHQFIFLEQVDVLKYAQPGGTFLLNTSPYTPDEVWDKLPRTVQEQIISKKLKMYAIDGSKVALDAGMGSRVNTIMQTCFFAISGVLPKDAAIEQIKKAIKKTYGRKGEEIVKKNYKAVDMTLENLKPITIPASASSAHQRPPTVSAKAPAFVQKVTAPIMAGLGDDLPVSAMPVDGTYPTGTTQWEKRNISLFVPAWEPELCIQCGNCGLVCPHSCVRSKLYAPAALDRAPESFKSADWKSKDQPGMKYTVQISAEDCTGCGLCVEVCPKKDKTQVGRKAINMTAKEPIWNAEKDNWAFFQTLPEVPRADLDFGSIKDVQFAEPLFEFSGACTGCGETPYVKILSQLFGDRAIIANATGCSSIYGGNLPTTPWTVNRDGRGPAWSNSLFEDNAEFGFGFRLTVDKHREFAGELLETLRADLDAALVDGLLKADQTTEAGIAAQRERVAQLRKSLKGISRPEARHLEGVAEHLVARSVWVLGGDGWAYDIGYGGLDHVLASGRNVNALVLDTEVYSNTGGQASKSTPRGAVAKFAAGGKPSGKKDIGLMAMSYGNIYVARISLGANPRHALNALLEAEAYPGPSLVIAYSHCIAHGINMQKGFDQQKKAVDSGHWMLCRYNPLLAAQGRNPLQIDSKPPSIPMRDYLYSETRFKMLTLSKPEAAEQLLKEAQEDVQKRWRLYERMVAADPADATKIAAAQ
ncbi:MAG: pyruvate:ferredoxin (flavodoxin) oxidoreductase [Kiritimatiellae bacterium]|nr:pyruvate:ferredoxin (flavodoxin) oxidoreductase [Kiritimatiellia bacterium]